MNRCPHCNRWLDEPPALLPLVKARADGVVDLVCRRLHVRREDLMSPARCKSVVRARQIAMWLIRRRSDLSWNEIGHLFGRDHSTVISSYQRVEKDRVLKECAESFARVLDGESEAA